MIKERPSRSFIEPFYDTTSESRYSLDGECAYSIPEDTYDGRYYIRNGCKRLELKGRPSFLDEIILPSSFCSFDVGSILCLPRLEKITAYSDFHFVDGLLCENCVSRFWEGTQLKEVCVLPWLVDKFKMIFGYVEGYKDVIKITAIPDKDAYQYTTKNYDFTLSEDGRTLIKASNKISVLEIPTSIERIAATAFDENNIIKKIIVLGNTEDRIKDRCSLGVPDSAVASLKELQTVEYRTCDTYCFQSHNRETGELLAKNIKEIIYPLWNHTHICYRGFEANCNTYKYIAKAKNFSSVELVEDNGIIYSKDGKFLVSGIDCKLKSVRIKDGVEEIFSYAFCRNEFIEEVHVPGTVKETGRCTFKLCRNLKKIVFNFEQISSEAEYAFMTCSKKVDFYLPASDFADLLQRKYDNIAIHTLPDYLGEVFIDEETGFVYDVKKEIFIGVIEEKAKVIKTLLVPKCVKEIAKNAFATLCSLEEIRVIPSIPIMTVYNYAKCCPYLKEIISGKEKIIFDNGIAYTNDYKEILGVSLKAKITNFVCKEGVECIASSAFEGHKELTRIQLPHTLTKISHRAFASTGITEIILPNSLKEIGNGTFASCNLSIVVYEGAISKGDNAFYGANFSSSTIIKVQREFKRDFIRQYPHLKHLVKTPSSKWFSWFN